MDESILTLDTAVVGGGITGLYTCLRLRGRQGPGHRMALFESSGRFGGRIETVNMDGFLAEYGPMRFEKMGQPLLMHLIRELGLETRPFPPYTPSTDPESLFDLREDENRPAAGKSGTGLFNALELLVLGILRILQKSGGDLNDPGDPRHRDWWAGLDETFYAEVRNGMAFQGEPIYRTGFWNILSRVLSHRALNQIIHRGTFYHVIHHNPGAAEWIIFWLRGLHPRDGLVGIQQGTEALITELVKKLSSPPSDPVPLHPNHRLTAIRQAEGNRILLELETGGGRTVRVLADHVVLALPWSAVRKLAHSFPDRIAKLVDSVIPIPLLKCFFVTKTPWWNRDTKPQTRASSVPAREIHYAFREEGKDRRGMVMVYGDTPSMNHWKPFVKNEPHLRAELNGDDRLVERYLRYLSPDPRNTDPAERRNQARAITCFGIRDWSREPFEAGCHIWKPGVNVEEAMDNLKGFSFPGAPSDVKNVHICGEAYSDYQGFIEGGLRLALKVVEQMGQSAART